MNIRTLSLLKLLYDCKVKYIYFLVIFFSQVFYNSVSAPSSHLIFNSQTHSQSVIKCPTLHSSSGHQSGNNSTKKGKPVRSSFPNWMLLDRLLKIAEEHGHYWISVISYYQSLTECTFCYLKGFLYLFLLAYRSFCSVYFVYMQSLQTKKHGRIPMDVPTLQVLSLSTWNVICCMTGDHFQGCFT